MDSNKLAKLQEIGYKIRNVCGFCKYSNFPHNDWGTCRSHIYAHKKHSTDERQLSIHKFGSCSKFKMDEIKAAVELGLYKDL